MLHVVQADHDNSFFEMKFIYTFDIITDLFWVGFFLSVFRKSGMDVEFFAITSFLSVLAGTGSYLNSVRKKGGWSWFGLLAETVLSLSVGLSVGYFSLSMQLEKDLTFFLIIVAANNSDDAITVTKKAVSSLIEKRFGIKLKKED